MSSLKTQIEVTEVKNFLRKNFSEDIRDVVILKGGEISQAFSFQDGITEYVIKVRKLRKRLRIQDPFRKEMIIADILKEQGFTFPVPRTVQYGILKEDKAEKFVYTIVEKASGKPVHLFPTEEAKAVDDVLIDYLHQIHLVDVSKTYGYGKWQDWSKASFSSMKEHLLDLIEKQKIYTNRQYSTGIYEIDLYEQGRRKILEFCEFCSPKRYLVHADYGYDNVLADEEGNINAIFDWEHSLFGDFVYDIAWIDFWCFRPKNTYSELYYKKYKDSRNLDFDNYDKRLQCYKLFIGMTAAGFFSESNQKDKYLESKKLIIELL
jgi:hygromycin-B 4-O-kinase